MEGWQMFGSIIGQVVQKLCLFVTGMGLQRKTFDLMAEFLCSTMRWWRCWAV